MIQVPGILINGQPFVCDEKVAILANGQVIVLQDKPAKKKFG